MDRITLSPELRERILQLEKKKRAVSMAVGRFYETYPQYQGGTKEDYENGALSAVTVL